MITLTIVIIILIIFYNDKIKKLNNEIYHLKQKGLNGRNFCPKCGADLRSLHSEVHNVQKEPEPTNNQSVIKENKVIKEQIPKPIPKKYNDKEIKNNFILITGSILLIISAILFLTTTWNITNNILKSGILFAMLLIFVTTSKIADKYLNLSNTSKAFHYIALAYLPIVLLSLSLFGLIGDYFSINGDGKFIYLTISSLIVTGVYYYFSYKSKEKILGIMSIIFSIITILFLGSCFTNIFTNLLLLLVIYLVVLTLLYKLNIYYIYDKLHFYTLLTLLIGLSFVSINNTLFTILTSNVTIIEIIIDFLLLFSFYLVLVNIRRHQKIFDEIYPLFIIYTFFNMTFLIDEFIFQQLIMIISFVTIFIINIIEHKYIRISSFVEVSISSLLLIFVTFIERLFKATIIPEFILFFIVTFFAYAFYYLYNKKSIIPALLFTLTIPVSIFILIIDQNWNLIILEYLMLLMIISSLFMKNDKRIQNSFKIIGMVVFNIFILLVLDCNYLSLLLIILYIALNIILFIKEKLGIYKVMYYIYTNILLMNILHIFNINNIEPYLIMIPVTSILFITMDLLIKKIMDNTSYIYIIIQSIIAFILLMFMSSSYINLLVLVLLFVSFILYLSRKNNNKKYTALLFIILIPFIYFKDYLIINDFNIMIIISTVFLICFACINYIKESKSYMVMYFLYAICHSITYSPSKYVTLMILSAGILINYIINEKEIKDLFKVILTTTILILLEFIIFDLHLNEITLIHYLPYIIYVPFITRTTIMKYTNSYKIFEYIGYFMINFVAFFNYTSEMDGILFVFLLTLVVIVSYIIKIGPIFIVSLVTILINVFLLTRNFWLSLPWWLYILVVGAILVGFAVYNELNEKKNNSFISKIRNRLDL